jgi:capsular polysaccharide biosynthesis protein
MLIKFFKNYNFTIIHNTDNTERCIGYSLLKNFRIVGRNSFNPNVLFYNNLELISPYDEKIMSLNKDSFYDNNNYEITKNKIIINEPVFFLIYNFDNYYHFLYDTIPILYTYLYLKKKINNLKLLVNYPNKYKKEFYKFNLELLENIINCKDMIIHNDNNIYSEIFISNSLTHGGYSNNKPRKEIFEIFDLIKSRTIKTDYKTPEYIYISRRTWINKDKSNIGTDYTTRRKMINEDLLVEKLEKLGFKEIYAENLTINEKINYFRNAKIIVGSIGGGMANLLFSTKNTKTIVIITPYFLDINYRFIYSLDTTDLIFFNDVKTHSENNLIPLYCRVKIINEKSKYHNKIGEIIEYKNDKYNINLSNNDIVGFNNNHKYENFEFYDYEFELLDKGLNSPYIIDIDNLVKKIINIM